MKDSEKVTRRPRPYHKHGLSSAIQALQRGLILDKRTRLGRAMNAHRIELVADLGGLDGISARQKGLVDVAVTLKLLADSAASWVLEQETIVNKRKRSLYPIVGELASLLSRYQSVMKDLGLERRPPPVKSLAEILRERDESRGGAA